MSVTRRSHIVRISDAPKGDPPSDTYVDMEILDSIAFRIEGNREVILDFKGGKIKPYIVDDTGDGNGKTPDDGTRRSHMKRITDKKSGNFFDVEVLDCIAFRDQNGEEWILNLPSTNASPFNISTGAKGDTRRTHNEKIAQDRTQKDPKDNYLTIERTDKVAFRTISGKEMIIDMASNDDPFSPNPRATTITTPANYNPNSDEVIPPPNTDDNVYAFFPKGGNPFTADEKISQGMLWWIRKANAGTAYVLITVIAENTVHGTTTLPPFPTLDLDLGDPKKQSLMKLIDSRVTGNSTVNRVGSVTIWILWSSEDTPPTPEEYVADRVRLSDIGRQLEDFAYSHVNTNPTIDAWFATATVPNPPFSSTNPNSDIFGNDGEWSTEAAAVEAARVANTGTAFRGAVGTWYALRIDLPFNAGDASAQFAQTQVQGQYLFKIPSSKTTITITMNNTIETTFDSFGDVQSAFQGQGQIIGFSLLKGDDIPIKTLDQAKTLAGIDLVTNSRNLDNSKADPDQPDDFDQTFLPLLTGGPVPFTFTTQVVPGTKAQTPNDNKTQVVGTVSTPSNPFDPFTPAP